MSLPQAFLASLSAQPESGEVLTTPEICGRQPREYLAKYDRDSHCWRTCQRSLLADTLEPFSETWPKSGLIVDGVCFQQAQPAHRTDAIGCLSWATPQAFDAKGVKDGNQVARKAKGGCRNLTQEVLTWPTPTSMDGTHGGRVTPRKSREGGNLIEAVSAAMFPTPAARDHKSGKGRKENGHTPQLPEVVGGQLNPTWVEWLMG